MKRKIGVLVFILMLIFVFPSFSETREESWLSAYNYNSSELSIIPADVLYEYGSSYVGKIVVTSIKVEDKSSTSLKANTSNNETYSFSIVADFSDKAEISSVSEGDTVIVIGLVDKMGTINILGAGKTVNLIESHIITSGITTDEIEAFHEAAVQNAEDVKADNETREANSLAAERQKYIDSCEQVNYSDVERNPNQFKGKQICITGKVIQVSEGWFSTVTLRVEQNDGNTWYVSYKRTDDNESRIIEKDELTIYGECSGVETYTSIVGSKVTIPALEAKYIVFGSAPSQGNTANTVGQTTSTNNNKADEAIAQLKDKVDTLTAENAQIKKEKERVEEDKKGLEAKNKDLSKKIQTLQSEIEKLSGDVSTLEQEKNRLAEEIQKITNYEDMSMEELVSLSNQVSLVINQKRIANASLRLEPDNCNVLVGNEKSVSLVCEGREITGETKILYESSDSSIVSFQENTITGISAGDAEIKASVIFQDGATLEAIAKVSVSDPIKSIKVPKTINGFVSQDLDIKELITVSPDTASKDILTYTVSDESVATIDDNGILKGLSNGKILLSIKYENEGEDKPVEEKCTVIIEQGVTAIKLDLEEVTIDKKGSAKVTAKIEPDNAKNKMVVWNSEDPSVAKVSNAGVITGVGSGTTIITCTAKDGSGATASIKVTVLTAVNAIQFSQNTYDITEKEKVKLDPVIKPSDATEKSLQWESSDKAIATVDENGIVTGRKTGKVTITATSKDGTGKKATVTVYVDPVVPVTVTSVIWQNVWGTKSGRMGIEAQNNSLHRKVTELHYRIRCKSAYSGEIAEDSGTFGKTLKPGEIKEGKISKLVISGFSTASKVEITITSITFSDGTVYEIPENLQESIVFTL